jgi:hypothetical protein
MSQVVLQCIADYAPMIRAALFRAGMPRLVIATSAVTTDGAATQTQSDAARALGRRLLLGAARGDRSWADRNLALQLFDSASPSQEDRLRPENFDAVAYASTRMLHAWTVPAWVDGRAYIDASYTCACPALEMADAGYHEVIAIAPDPGPVYRDLARTEALPETRRGVPIHMVRPDADPSNVGVDYADATEAGLVEVYWRGEEQGREFLASCRRQIEC